LETLKRRDHFGFISGLFNDAKGASDYIASNGRVVTEQRNGKDVEGSGCGLICGTLLEFADGTEENNKYPKSG
jgi:hypothetical protein